MIILIEFFKYLFRRNRKASTVSLTKEKAVFDFAYLKKTLLSGFLILFFLIGVEITVWGLGLYDFYRSSTPIPSPEAMLNMPEATRFYDRNGEFLYEMHGDMKRRFIPLKHIPKALKDATIAIEDKNFYNHKGYDLKAIIRAFYKNYRNNGISQGASTITQQLARTMFLTQEKAYSRKIREIILAIEIEKRYSKDQILEMYLNNIPYGSIAYGVSAASEIYFSKPVNKLSTMESAYLAALPKAPSNYSPFGGNREALDERAKLVIRSMQESGYLKPQEASEALAMGRPEFVSPPHLIRAPHFVFYAIEELSKTYGHLKIRDGGFDVYTTLDMNMQREAEKVIEKWGKINEKKYGAGNAALTAVDPSTGEILAMVGSRNFFDPKGGSFNAATSLRQPGSSFKPYVYATAFSNGLSPDSIIVDSQTNFKNANYGVNYIPRNYSGHYYGPVTVRKALAGSLNIPAVKTLVQTGINKVIDTAEKMGISTLGDRKRFGPSLALGGGEVKLIEHTAAMGAFGNGGKKQKLSPILEIKKRNGELVYEKPKEEGQQSVSEKSAYWISDILSDNKAREYIFGRSGKLSIPGFKVAVKTGTTQDYHDAWTVGFTPSISVGVWSGNNDNKPMKKGADGSFVAAPIWKEFMTFALGKVAKKDFVMPKEIREELAKKKKDFQTASLKKTDMKDLKVFLPIGKDEKSIIEKAKTDSNLKSNPNEVIVKPLDDVLSDNSVRVEQRLKPLLVLDSSCQDLPDIRSGIRIIKQTDILCQAITLPIE